MSIYPDEQHNGEKTNDILREYAGLLTDVTDMVASIDIVQPPHDKNDLITIPVFDDAIQIPKQVREYIGDVSDIVLSFDIPELPETEFSPFVEYDDPLLSSVSIEFVGKEKTYLLSRVNGVDAKQYDHVVDIQPVNPENRATFGKKAIDALRHQGDIDDDFLGYIQEIPSITTAEFNALIMSLVYPDDNRGYEMFDAVNLLDPKVLEHIRESVQLGLNTRTDSIAYTFGSSDHTSLVYTKTQGQPVSFRLSYEDIEKARTIVVQHNLETDFRITFSTVDLIPDLHNDFIPGTVDFAPTVEDVVQLRKVLQREIAATHETPLDIDAIDIIDETEIDPAQKFSQAGHDYFSPGYTDATLDSLELSLSETDEPEQKS